MNWTQKIGQKKLIEILQDSINKDRVAHAQLFVGEEGYGGLPLVLAYAQELFRRENEHSVTKVETLNHIDLHFSFPVFTKNNNSLSKNFFHEWREMILANPYASIHEWGEILDTNKQLLISVDEVEEWGKTFSLKSYEGGTDFETPLRRGIEIISEKENYRKADILMVTDGSCRISYQFKRVLKEEKERLDFKIYTVICEADRVEKDFSDGVIVI